MNFGVTMIRPLCICLAGLVVGQAYVPPAEAAQKPLWEFGLGVGALAFSDYRGADAMDVYPLPLPYFVYRGTFLRADRDGMRGRFLKSDLAELNISVNGTTPVRSHASGARVGMPDLKPTLEVGPSLELHLWRSIDRRVALDLRLPARVALTIESSPRAIGVLFEPRLNLDVRDVGGLRGWTLGLLAGPLFADRRYHQYFYGVPTQFALPARPAYDAHGGYAGTQAIASLSKRYPRYWVGTFLRHDTLSGAVFTPSPLVRTNRYWAAGIGIAWMIGESTQHVETPDDGL